MGRSSDSRARRKGKQLIKFLHYSLRDLIEFGACAEALEEVEAPLQEYERHKLAWEDCRWEKPAAELTVYPKGSSPSGSSCNSLYAQENESVKPQAYGGYQPY